MTAPDPRVGEIEDRLSAATPGPWDHGHHWDASAWVKGGAGGRKFRPASDTSYEWLPTPEDAIFIANAPADVAYLLGELRKAHEALARVEGLAEKWEMEFPSKAADLRAAVAAAKGDEHG